MTRSLGRVLSALFVALICLPMGTPSAVAQAPKRVALVIGNADYQAISSLPNADRDAMALSEALGRLGFDVKRLANADLAAMRRGAEEFERATAGADAALVFFAGHALRQRNAATRLVPVDANLQDQAGVERTTLPLASLETALAKARNGFLLTDGCSDARLAERLQWIGATLGMAAPVPRSGALIATASAEGSACAERLFIDSLLVEMEEPGIDAVRLFRRTQQVVAFRSNGRQQVAVADGLVAPFFFGRDDLPVSAYRRLGVDPVVEAMRGHVGKYGNDVLTPVVRSVLGEKESLQGRPGASEATRNWSNLIDEGWSNARLEKARASRSEALEARWSREKDTQLAAMTPPPAPPPVAIPSPQAVDAEQKAEEQRRAEDLRKAEEQRKAAEALRQAEEQRKAAEALRQAEEQRKAAEELRKAEEQRKAAEALRQAEEQRKTAEALRQAEEQRKAAEALRQAEEQRKAAEALRQAEEQRKAAEALRKAEEQRKAAEALHQAEEQRKAAEALRQAEDQRKAAEALRQAEEQRKAFEAQRQAEEQRKAAEAQRQAEEQRKPDPKVATLIPPAAAPNSQPTPKVEEPPAAARLEPTPAPVPPPPAEPNVASLPPPSAAPATPPQPPAPAFNPDSADSIRAAQQELKRLGCYFGEVDGVTGPGTRGALGAAAGKMPGVGISPLTEPGLKALREQKGILCPPAPTVVRAVPQPATPAPAAPPPAAAAPAPAPPPPVVQAPPPPPAAPPAAPAAPAPTERRNIRLSM